MTISNTLFARLLVAGVLLTACSAGQQHLAVPAPGPLEGVTTIAQASQEANAGRYAVADKLLADYIARFPGTSEAADALYWRALYKLDPANPSASARDATQLLDGYIASSIGTHRTEAQSLRRVSVAMEMRAAAAANQSTVAKAEPPKPDDKAKDEELQRVKDELAKANAELERIKRRLTQPKP